MATDKVSDKPGDSPLRKVTCYTAFIDILGFKELLDSSRFEEKIEAIVDKIRSRIRFDGRVYPSLNYLAISDTIIITAEEQKGALLLRKVGQIQTTLLKLGYATRGGISFGENLVYSGDIGRNIFGKAYVSAYQAEQELAIYPRVVVLDSARKNLKADFASTTNRDFSQYVLKDLAILYLTNPPLEAGQVSVRRQASA